VYVVVVYVEAEDVTRTLDFRQYILGKATCSSLIISQAVDDTISIVIKVPKYRDTTVNASIRIAYLGVKEEIFERCLYGNLKKHIENSRITIVKFLLWRIDKTGCNFAKNL